MKKWIAIFISFMFCLPAFAITNPNFTAARAVIENWFSAMKDNQTAKAASYLAPQFLSLHTDGVTRNKKEEIDLIQNLHMQSYRLDNFNFSQSGDVVVVTFSDTGAEKIDDEVIDPKPAGRMAVLQQQGSQWLIVAYANLDRIGGMNSAVH